MLQIHGNWQFTSVINYIASEEEDNAAAAAATKEEEDLRQAYLKRRLEAVDADLERRMEAATEEAEINERGMNEAAKTFEVKAAAEKTNAFLLFLVRVHSDRCTMF